MSRGVRAASATASMLPAFLIHNGPVRLNSSFFFVLFEISELVVDLNNNTRVVSNDNANASK